MILKRGQISIFILLISVLIIMFFFIFYLDISDTKKTEVETSTTLPFTFESIKLFINSCLDDTAENGIYFLGLQGGYYDSDSIISGELKLKIPYYWYQGEDKMPSKEEIEIELSRYVKDKLPECINDFDEFKKQGYEINAGDINVISKINEEDVDVKLEYPIESTIGSEVFKIDEFLLNLDFNFNEKYNIVKRIMEEQKKTPNSVPLGFIAYSAFNNNFTFENIYLDNDDVFYMFIFEREAKDPFIYTFLADYNWTELREQNFAS